MSFVSCEDGRNPIGVDQPIGGSNYPFLAPSTDIQYLVADFYLGYEAEDCQFVRPFHIAWMYNFGATVNSNPGGSPTPTHTYDILIKDANGTTVFNSTVASSFVTRTWGTRLRVVEWRSDSAVCRIVVHTCWDENLQPIYVEYNRYLVPVSGVLDDRSTEQIASRLKTLIVETHNSGDVTVDPHQLQLVSGYNMQMITEALDTLQGTMETVDIEISALAGAGLGQFEGCGNADGSIRSLNGIGPDPNGNFLLDALGCYRVDVPSSVATSSPRTINVTPNALRITNDCGPCCHCSQFEAVYNAIVRLNNKFTSLGRRASCTRDQYVANRARWITAGQNRLANPLRLAVIPGSECRVEVAGALCNNSGECLENVELRFSFVYSNVDYPSVTAATSLLGTPTCGLGFRSGNEAPIPSQAGCLSLSTVQRYAMHGDWPVLSGYFDKIPKAAMAYLRFQVDLADCADTDHVDVVLEARDGDGNLLKYAGGWPDSMTLDTNIAPIGVTSSVFDLDPCSSSSSSA